MYECQVVIGEVAAKIRRQNDWGFVFDTAHAFVQGQPLTSAKDVETFLEDAKRVRISAIHLNGSKYPFRSGRDVHAPAMSTHDYIWGSDSSGLALLLDWIMQKDIPAILECPGWSEVGDYKDQRSQLKRLVEEKKK
jgi:endonuclease IV